MRLASSGVLSALLVLSLATAHTGNTQTTGTSLPGATPVALPVSDATAAQPTSVRAEVITGRVAAIDGTPIKTAVVIATMAPERLTFMDTVDASGQYTLRIAKGTGDYLVYISAPGFAAFRKRITRARFYRAKVAERVFRTRSLNNAPTKRFAPGIDS